MRDATIVCIAFAFVVVVGAGTVGAVDNRNEFITTTINTTTAGDVANVTVILHDLGGGGANLPQDITSLDGRARLCRSNLSHGTNVECWNGGSFSSGDDGSPPLDPWIRFAQGQNGSFRELSDDRWLLTGEERLPDEDGRYTLQVSVKIVRDLGTDSFVESDEIVNVSTPTPTFGSSDHSLQDFTEEETNTLLFWSLVIVGAMFLRLTLVAMVATTAWLGVLIDTAWPVSVTFGLALTMIALWLQYAARAFAIKDRLASVVG